LLGIATACRSISWRRIPDRQDDVVTKLRGRSKDAVLLNLLVRVRGTARHLAVIKLEAKLGWRRLNRPDDGIPKCIAEAIGRYEE
jgi:hypothetical protein